MYFNDKNKIHNLNILLLIYIQQDAALHIYFWKTAVHVLGGISNHHQEHKQLYSQYLVLLNRYCYLLTIVEELELV